MWSAETLVPRKGFFCFLAQLMAWIFPSVPLTPKPPGTRMPLRTVKHCHVDKSPILIFRLDYLVRQDIVLLQGTHSELQSFCHASWYFTGSSCRVLGSKLAESIYWEEEMFTAYMIGLKAQVKLFKTLPPSQKQTQPNKKSQTKINYLITNHNYQHFPLL